MDASSVKNLVEQLIPFVKKTGVVADELSATKVKLRLPHDPTNLNPMGILHAGAEVGSATPADLFKRGAGLVEKHAARDPRGALAILDAVARTAPDHARAAGLRRDLLERIVVADPNDLDAVSNLAVVCEEQGDLKKCAALLQPHAVDGAGEPVAAATVTMSVRRMG